MKGSGESVRMMALLWLLAGLGVVAAVATAWGQPGRGGEDGAVAESAVVSYASLPDLVTMVCEDAMAQFEDFFGPEPVLVSPFMVLGEFSGGRISMLGATLADQMTAVINNQAEAQPGGNESEYDQRLQGVLQEMDGYLRIHISGQNDKGERRSYVANVEMSEPIYRALHSYVAMN